MGRRKSSNDVPINIDSDSEPELGPESDLNFSISGKSLTIVSLTL